MMRRRLFWKLFLAFWLANCLTFLVGAGAFMLDELRGDNPALRTLLGTELHLLQRFGEQAGRQLLEVSPQPPDVQIGLYDAQGRLLAGKPVQVVRFEQSVLDRDGRLLLLRASVPSVSGQGPPPRGLGPLVTGTLMSALFALLCSLYLTRPLAWLREAMGQVAQGRFEVRVRPRLGRRRDEIVDLAEDCDRMAGQLKTLVEAQQHLLHDISHELRSPLTRLNAAIGLMRQQPDRREMIARIERESRRMDDLIEQLLTLARAQSPHDSGIYEALDAVELLAQIVEDARFEAGIKQCQVLLVAPQPFITVGHEELLYRAFENVIRNAVRYTAPGTEVRVEASLLADGERLQVSISDHGPGVAPTRLESIFQPFDRGADNGGDGFGLGLAIARRAIELHHGSISAQAADDRGLMVRIELPQLQGLRARSRGDEHNLW
ncbi:MULTISPECIES: sensor histidine kinase KdpD [Pseudomonas]|uniref:histidine kinase n=1 Tax=Pseudomonas taiwanensis TaxID=470150 RepID=A0ABR6VD92_9PSED|nr:MULTISPECIES: ATP-binding protein [Pseudomonas]AGZ35174.1 integral membrane sensor signal transduction histidine kinase [Pseudomonas sp. VLB120]MBC3478513.1 HAMP domain-containing protein [Pseudomonas taiwanensis]MBC3493478.1 HAMP domain-containing protein [Pseudomonas taiwanensis]MPS99000.1 HAMP domain-containing protein [Pseudomonas sp.]QQZ38474.1 HAMP domain-containing protein [Pseudomonas sp. SK2]